VPDGAEVSENEAIYIAFPRLTEVTCDKFTTMLQDLEGGLRWGIVLSKRNGCTETRYIDAESGETLSYASGGCP
jgi:hypothetical protein